MLEVPCRHPDHAAHGRALVARRALALERGGVERADERQRRLADGAQLGDHGRPDEHERVGGVRLRLVEGEQGGLVGGRLDPAREIVAVSGSKEGIAHLLAAYCGPGDVALVPDVYYPVYARAPMLHGAEVAFLQAVLQGTTRSVSLRPTVLGRRGPEHAAFTLPELVGLAARDDIDLRVDAPDGIDPDAATTRQGRLKAEYLARIAARPAGGEAPADGLDSPAGPDDTSGPDATERRRIILRFQTAPVEVVGSERAEGLRVVRTDLVGGVQVTLADPD